MCMPFCYVGTLLIDPMCRHRCMHAPPLLTEFLGLKCKPQQYVSSNGIAVAEWLQPSIIWNDWKLRSFCVCIAATSDSLKGRHVWCAAAAHSVRILTHVDINEYMSGRVQMRHTQLLCRFLLPAWSGVNQYSPMHKAFIYILFCLRCDYYGTDDINLQLRLVSYGHLYCGNPNPVGEQETCNDTLCVNLALYF